MEKLTTVRNIEVNRQKLRKLFGKSMQQLSESSSSEVKNENVFLKASKFLRA